MYRTQSLHEYIDIEFSEEETEKQAESFFIAIMAENFLNLGKEVDTQNQ